MKMPNEKKDNDFFNIEPSWKCYSSSYIGNAERAKFFDEVSIQVLPIFHPIDEKDINSLYLIEHEHTCHSAWCTELSGCIQRGISLIGTEAVMTLLKNCVQEGRKVTLPLDKHIEKNDKWIVDRLVWTEATLKAMKFNDIFVQEIGAILIGALTLKEHVFPEKRIARFEEESLNSLSRNFNNDKLKEMIFPTYENLKRNVYRYKRKTWSRKLLVDSIVRASLNLLIPLPKNYSNTSEWKKLIQDLDKDYINTNSVFRFFCCIEALPDVKGLLKNTIPHVV